MVRHCSLQLLTSTDVIVALNPAKTPTKKALQSLITATKKYLTMSEWAVDKESDKDGPVDAKAFLDEIMGTIGVKPVGEPAEGREHVAAGEPSCSHPGRLC